MSLLSSIVRNAVVVAVVAGSVGCASVQRASKERDAEVKAFTTNPAKANVYVFRDEFLGNAKTMTVVLDGKAIGETQGHTFLFTPVDPGPHKLLSKAENDSELPFTAQAGASVFVWQEVKMGILGARSELHLVDEARGRQGVGACDLVLPPPPAASAPEPVAAPPAVAAPAASAPAPAPAVAPASGPVIRGGQWSPGEPGAYRPPGT